MTSSIYRSLCREAGVSETHRYAPDWERLWCVALARLEAVEAWARERARFWRAFQRDAERVLEDDTAEEDRKHAKIYSRFARLLWRGVKRTK